MLVCVNVCVSVCVLVCVYVDSQVIRFISSALQTQRLEDADRVPARQRGMEGMEGMEGMVGEGKVKEEEVTEKTNQDRNRDGDGD